MFQTFQIIIDLILSAIARLFSTSRALAAPHVLCMHSHELHRSQGYCVLTLTVKSLVCHVYGDKYFSILGLILNHPLLKIALVISW